MRVFPNAASAAPVTIIVPAFNEEACLADTLASLLRQTSPAAEVIVVDDCSTDGTGDLARSFGVTVVRPPVNMGSKAGAQSYALQFVRTEFVAAVDADTTLAPDAVERLLDASREPGVAAACGTVLPRIIETVWERGRYVEYLFAFTFYKRVQDGYGAPLISSGCFSMYRTSILREAGGWSTRTLAEDMDLTWTLFQRGHAVRFIPEALCFPLEPHDFVFMRRQLKRWSHGFIQNVRLHWRGLLEVPFLRSMVAVACWDAVIASIVYLMLLPFAAIWFRNPYLLLGYVIDVPAILIPVVAGALPRRECARALASLPSFFVLRTVNAIFFLTALWAELVCGRTFQAYEKGH